MREAAASARAPGIHYVDGTAEALGFARGTVALVTAAQAAQWFDRERFYAEARRVLTLRGVVAILQNNRAWWDCPLLAAYEELLERLSPGYDRRYRDIDFAAELETAGGFSGVDRAFVWWTRRMTPEQFKGLARSSTQVRRAVDHHGEDAVMAALDQQLSRFAGEAGELDVPYRAELCVATLGRAQR